MGILFDDANPDYFTHPNRFVSSTSLTLFAIHKTDDSPTSPQYLLTIGNSADWWALAQSKDLPGSGLFAETKHGLVSKKALSGIRYGGWVASCAVFLTDTVMRIYTNSVDFGFTTVQNFSRESHNRCRCIK